MASNNRRTRSKKSINHSQKGEDTVEEKVMSKKGSSSGKGNELRLIAEDAFNDHEVEVIDTAVVETKKVERA
jgi:hypothetical protein